MQLAFVHGIGAPRRPEEECRKWVEALASGARAAGHSDIAAALIDRKSVQTHYVYYRDLYLAPKARHETLGLNEPQIQDLADLMLEMIDERLSDLHPSADATGDSSAAERALIRARTQIALPGQQQGFPALLRRSINAATTLLSFGPLKGVTQWVSGRLMVADLAQVVRYLDRKEPDQLGRTIDQRIRDRVLARLGGEPAIVIAHSLGTVVTYEALSQFRGRVPLWVTLGSPLGMRAVIWHRLVPKPPSTPDCVGQWLNFWDRDDILVSRTKLEKDVRASRTEVRPQSRRVDSDGAWVHSAVKYLAHADVAGPVAEVLRPTAIRVNP